MSHVRGSLGLILAMKCSHTSAWDFYFDKTERETLIL
jgi:hypothetical protein